MANNIGWAAFPGEMLRHPGQRRERLPGRPEDHGRCPGPCGLQLFAFPVTLRNPKRPTMFSDTLYEVQ